VTEGKVGSPAMVAVAFTRTCGWQARDRSDDELRDWRGYVGWARSAGALRREDARRQAGLNMMRPGAAMRALDRARALRTSIYRLLVACAPAGGRREGIERAVVGISATPGAGAGGIEAGVALA